MTMCVCVCGGVGEYGHVCVCGGGGVGEYGHVCVSRIISRKYDHVCLCVCGLVSMAMCVCGTWQVWQYLYVCVCLGKYDCASFGKNNWMNAEMPQETVRYVYL